MTSTGQRSSRRARAGSGGITPAFVVLVAPLLALAIAAVAVGGQGAARAQAAPVVGLDLDAAGNTATSLGPIDSCTRVHAGDQFDVDVYVKDVPPIDGVQATVHYDPQLLRPVSSDVKLFLNVKPGSNLSGLPKPSQDPGAYLIAGFDLGGDTAEAGSGAAIRITFEATAAGTSDLQATDVIIIDAGGAPLQPHVAGGFFTGTVTGGVVAIDAVCDTGATPTPEASTTAEPTSEASATAPSGTAVPSALAGTATSAAGTATAASAVGELTPGAASTGAAGTAQAGSTAGAAAEPTFQGEARAASKTPRGAGGPGATQDQQRDGGGDGFSPLWWLPIGAGVLLLAGGAAVAWRRYARGRSA